MNYAVTYVGRGKYEETWYDSDFVFVKILSRWQKCLFSLQTHLSIMKATLMKAMLITKFGECLISSLELKDTIINLCFCFDFLHFDGITRFRSRSLFHTRLRLASASTLTSALSHLP